MKRMYIYCEKYHKRKSKEEFAKSPLVHPKCSEPRKKYCGLCRFNRLEWKDEELCVNKKL